MATLSACTAPSLGSPQFVLQWGSAGSGPGQWGNLYGAAADDSQHVFLADETNHRIEKFTSTGTFLMQWGSLGSAPGQFRFPGYIAVDHSYHVYVVDTGNNRVEKFDSVGNLVTTWGSTGDGLGQFVEPQGIAVDNAGFVYVADRGDQTQVTPPFLHWRIEKFTSDGAFVATWGSLGNQDGQFGDLSGVGTNGTDRVYVLDPNRNFVNEFTVDGTFVRKWGSVGTAPGFFMGPSAVAVDVHDGNRIYVTDFDNDRVQEFNSTGELLDAWGTLGTGPGQFEAAAALAVDAVGFVYVGSFGDRRLEKFLRTSLVGVDAGGGARRPLRVAPSPAGQSSVITFQLVDDSSVEVSVFDTGGRRVRTLTTGMRERGTHSITWNLRDAGERRVHPGVYLVEFQDGRRVERSKLVVVD
jgi:DNA-binding beta-propeller fold protein YncE